MELPPSSVRLWSASLSDENGWLHRTVTLNRHPREHNHADRATLRQPHRPEGNTLPSRAEVTGGPPVTKPRDERWDRISCGLLRDLYGHGQVPAILTFG